MTTKTLLAHPEGVAPAPTLRAESEAIYAAAAAGALGAIFGLLVALIAPDRPLADTTGGFGVLAAIGAGVIAAAAAAVGYWRSRKRPGQEWRKSLASWKFTVNTISVVIVHTALAFLATYAGFRLLGLGFIGLPVITFWAILLMTVTLGLTAYIVYLSVSRMTTQRMSTLLMAFIVIGTLTAMITSPEPDWWKVHFSQLGTFDDLSSFVFNGTLIAGGLLVTTFAVYIGNDLQQLADEGVLANPRGPRIVSPALRHHGDHAGLRRHRARRRQPAHPQSRRYRHGSDVPRAADRRPWTAARDAACLLHLLVGILRGHRRLGRAVRRRATSR